MKKILWLVLATALYSCDPGNMTTIVHTDGSCERVFVAKATDAFIKGDSTNNPFPVSIDKNWQLQWQYEDEEKLNPWPLTSWVRQPQDSLKQIKVYAKRKFASANDMASNFRFNTKSKWNELVPQPVFEKKFRWFYTYYSYSETYPRLLIQFPIPLEKYMSKDEADFWLTGMPAFDKGISGMDLYEKLSALKEKFESWASANGWEFQYAAVLRNLDQLPGNPGYEKMLNEKDLVYKSVSSENKEDHKVINIGKVLNEYFRTNAFAPLMNEQNEISRLVNNPVEMVKLNDYTSTYFKYQLVMPGQLLAANGLIKKDTIVWNLDATKMLNGNYTLTATSKKMNIWAVIVSSFVVLLAIVLLIRKRA